MPEKKFKPQLNLRDSYYGEYRLNNPNKKVDCKMYLEIVGGFIEHLVDILFSGSDIRIPDGLGIMEIYGRKKTPWVDDDGKIRGVAVDKGGTKKLHASDPEAKANKTILYHFNEHTDGFAFKLRWVKKDVNIKHKFNYFFRLMRARKRTVPKLLKDNIEFLKK